MNTKTSSNGKRMAAKAADVCPHCDGMGFVIPNVRQDDPRFGRAVPCVCKRSEIEANRLDRLAQVSQLGALKNLQFDSFMPDGIGLPPAKARNLQTAYNTAELFSKDPDGWLVLRGGYGSGKTHLAAAIANAQLAAGKPVLFINTPDLLDHLRATYNPSSPVSYDERFAQVRNASLLILDALGSHNGSEWAQEKLYQIFNYRYNARLATVITTNEPIDAIEVRIRSRLSDLSFVQMVTILAPDFRRGGVYQEESELSTLHLHQDKTFSRFNLRQHELPRTQSANLARALEVAQAFAAEPKHWLVLNGHAYGNGKTHLAAAIANAANERGDAVLLVVVPD
ncbi:MAG: ATP-binding protein, partial [Methylococcales bacterium]|nr:ATP-binding protein [Methylococcales bacterium]